MSFQTTMRQEVENTLGCELFPAQLPDPVDLPAATFLLISEVRTDSHDGDSGLTTRRYQFDLVAMTEAEVDQLDQQLVERYKPGRGTYGELVLENVRIQSARGDIDPLTGRYKRMRDLLFVYKE